MSKQISTHHVLLPIHVSALVDTDFVFGIDCDAAALERAQANIKELELDDSIFLIQASVGNDESNLSKVRNNKGSRLRKSVGKGGRGRQSYTNRPQKPASLSASAAAANQKDDGEWIFPLRNGCVDTVLTNPPFGTKPDKAGIDIKFVKLGCQLARRSVYSFHKSSTRDFVLKTIKALPYVDDVAVIAEMKFDLPRTYKFHNAASVDIEVDLIRVQLKGDDLDVTALDVTALDVTALDVTNQDSENDTDDEDR